MKTIQIILTSILYATASMVDTTADFYSYNKGMTVVVSKSVEYMHTTAMDLVDKSSDNFLNVDAQTLYVTNLTLGYKWNDYSLSWTYGDESSLKKIGAFLTSANNITNGSGSMYDYMSIFAKLGVYDIYADSKKTRPGFSCFGDSISQKCQSFNYKKMKLGFNYRYEYELLVLSAGFQYRTESVPMLIGFGDSAESPIADTTYPLYNKKSEAYGMLFKMQILPFPGNLPHIYADVHLYLGGQPSIVKQSDLPNGWVISDNQLDMVYDMGFNIGYLINILSFNKFLLDLDLNADMSVAGIMSNSSVYNKQGEQRSILLPMSNLYSKFEVRLISAF